MRYDDPLLEAPPEDISNMREVRRLPSRSLSTPIISAALESMCGSLTSTAAPDET